MKIRFSAGSVAFLFFALTVCIAQVYVQQAQSQTAAQPATGAESAAAASGARVEKLRQRHQQDLKFNFKAKLNNGSTRKGLTLAQLPKSVRQQAQQIAGQYKTGIYPVLKKYLAEHGILPNGPRATTIPELRAYMKSPSYKGTGSELLGHLSWSMGSDYRLDGTYASRDTYSKNPTTAPHDVWASNSRFWASVQENGHTPLKFLIVGWDDGQVTFESFDQVYTATRDTPSGIRRGIAVPGAAGIPPDTPTMKEYITQQE